EGKVDAGRVATRPGEADDEAESNRIVGDAEHDRNGCSRRFRRQGRCGASSGDDHGDLAAHQLGRHRRQSIVLTLAEAIFDRYAYRAAARLWRKTARICALAAAEPPLRYPITGTFGCCARAASGHAAVLPRSVMNSRRFTASGSRASTER